MALPALGELIVHRHNQPDSGFVLTGFWLPFHVIAHCLSDVSGSMHHLQQSSSLQGDASSISRLHVLRRACADEGASDAASQQPGGKKPRRMVKVRKKT